MPGKRGRPAHLIALWPYLLIMQDRIDQSGQQLRAKAVAAQIVRRHGRTMPSKNFASAVAALTKFQRTYQARLRWQLQNERDRERAEYEAAVIDRARIPTLVAAARFSRTRYPVLRAARVLEREAERLRAEALFHGAFIDRPRE